MENIELKEHEIELMNFYYWEARERTLDEVQYVIEWLENGLKYVQERNIPMRMEEFLKWKGYKKARIHLVLENKM